MSKDYRVEGDVMAESEKTPAWDIFNRLERLEEKMLEQVDKTDVELTHTQKDTVILARTSFLMAYWYHAENSVNPRQEIPDWVKLLSDQGLNKDTTNILIPMMSSICGIVEEGKKS
jgi:hypothetical protein